jgi:RHS repeat-associated protein
MDSQKINIISTLKRVLVVRRQTLGVFIIALGLALPFVTHDTFHQTVLTPLFGEKIVDPDTKVKQLKILDYAQLPLRFEQNLGQTDDEVMFLSRGTGYTLFLTPTETVLTLQREIDSNNDINHAVIRTTFVDANIPVEFNGNHILPGKVNYLIGRDQNKWLTGISTYTDVIAKDIYSGIDLRYHGDQQQLEYDFIVAPGITTNKIQLQFDGIDSLTLNDVGDLILETEQGALKHKKPIVYQDINGERISIEGSYLIAKNDIVMFEIGKYDSTYPLVIDPILDYATYLGGDDEDQGLSITIDEEGAAYIAGTTHSAWDFPITDGALQTELAGSEDSFIVKLSPDGQAIDYATYFGGTGQRAHRRYGYGYGYGYGHYSRRRIDIDEAHGVAVNNLGQAVIVGRTSSKDDFPIQSALQAEYGGGDTDAYIAKLNNDGSDILYSTYLGGRAKETAHAVELDADGRAHIVGETSSRDFPIKQALQDKLKGYSDAFVTKINSNGNSIEFSTYLGGRRFDQANDLSLDNDGQLYITGTTYSRDFPVKDAYQDRLKGWSNAFVVKLKHNGAEIDYATYLGGYYHDAGYAIAIDNDNAVSITGTTYSRYGFPITDDAVQIQHAGGYSDAYVIRLNEEGDLSYGTYLGGQGRDEGLGIGLDGAGHAYITGLTRSSNFPVVDAIQPELAQHEHHPWWWYGYGRQTAQDAFITHLRRDGTELIYSTYLGGKRTDRATAIATDDAGNAYITGTTASRHDFPLFIPVQATFGGGESDAFVAKIQDVNVAPVITSEAIITANANESYDYDVDAEDDNGDPLIYRLTQSPTGMTINEETGEIIWLPDNDGEFDVEITVDDQRGGSDTQNYIITVGQGGTNQAPAIISTAITEAFTHQLYSYDVDANDPNGDTLIYSLQISPAGMLIDSNTGLITWTPTSTGDVNVTVLVDDNNGETDTQSFVINVTDNTSPVVTPPADITIEATGPMTTVSLGTATATDLVDGTLTPTADNTGPFSVGIHTITWSATDAAGNTGTATQIITVTDTTHPVITEPPDMLFEATGPTTSVNLGTATAIDLVDGVLTPTPSNTGPFSVGFHSITWQAIDSSGNGAAALQSIIIRDSTAPIVTAPADITIEATGATTIVSLGTATASDLVDGALTPTVDNSGPFAVGVHTITWSASDTAGNVGSTTQTVTVTDTTAPTVTSPADITIEATGATTTVTLGTPTATDLVDGVLTPTADNTGPFTVGAHTVTWSATDTAGNIGLATQMVIVTDTTAPTVTPPADITIEATGATTTVTLGTVTATDLIDGTLTPTVDNTGPFAVGIHTITWSATDTAGNVGNATQTVTVTDTTAPTVTPPTDITIEATGATTIVSLGTATASDLVDGTLTPTVDNTGPFAVGIHTITWSATDTAGNIGSATQTVTVTDTTAPIVTPPTDITVEATGATTTVTLGTATATDLVDGTLTATADNTGPFAVGVHTIIWSATDAAGNTGSATQTVTIIEDVTAPVITVTSPQEGITTNQSLQTIIGNLDESGVLFIDGVSIPLAPDNSFTHDVTLQEGLNSFNFIASDSQGVTTSNEFLVNTFTQGNQSIPQVATLLNNESVVVWQSLDDGAGDPDGGISGQRLDADGNKLGSEFLVNTTTAGLQSKPSVAHLGNGSFIVVWSSPVPDPGPLPPLLLPTVNTVGQLFDVNGNKIGTEFVINNVTIFSSPAIANLGNGESLVVWTESDFTNPSPLTIKAQNLASDGSLIGTSFEINTSPVDIGAQPDVATLNDGSVVIVWHTSGLLGGSDFKGQKYDANLIASGTEFSFIANTNIGNLFSSFPFPRVATLSNDELVVSWQGTNPSGSSDVFVRRLDSDGNTLGNEVQVNTNTNNNTNTDSFPDIASLTDGSFVITWQSNDPTISDTSGLGIVGQKFTVNGTKSGNEFLINTLISNDQQQAKIAGLPNGNFIIIWQTADPLSGDTDNGIAARIGVDSLAGNISTLTLNLTLDTIAPVITISSPLDGSVTNQANQSITGMLNEAAELTFNGNPVILDPDNSFNIPVTLLEGENSFSFVATDSIGNASAQSLTVTLDSIVPIITIISPANDTITTEANQTITGSLDSDATLTINGQLVTLNLDNSFDVLVTLAEGGNGYTFEATDAGNNVTTQTLNLILDSIAPVITIISPANGAIVTQELLTITGNLSEVADLTINSAIVIPAIDNSFIHSLTLAPGSNIISFVATDEAGNIETQSITVTLSSLPVITSTPITSGDVGTQYNYDVNANDPDGNLLTYRFNSSPSGMIISSISGLITWVPTAKGPYAVTVQVDDGVGGTVTQSFNILVANRSPSIISTPVTTGNDNSPYTYDADATDPDGDDLLYSLETRPTGMTIDSVTGVINWLPDATGDFDVTVRVGDGDSGTDTQSFMITIDQVNNLPTITSTAVLTTTVDANYQYQLTATDTDNDTLSYSLTTAPLGMAVDSITGLISWIPNTAGTFQVVANAEDGKGGVAAQTYQVTVNYAPGVQPPGLAAIGNQVAPLGSTLKIQLSATDPDGNDLMFIAEPMPIPANMTLDAASGLFTFKPALDQVGDFVITFIASDGRFTDAETITITVPAPSGITRLHGQVITTGGAPLANVSMEVDGVAALTDASGNFMLDNLPNGGDVRLLVDGSTVDPALGTFATVPEMIPIIAGADNMLEPAIVLLPLDVASADMVVPTQTSIVTSSRAVEDLQIFEPVTLTIPAGKAVNQSDGSMFSGEIHISRIEDATQGPRPLPPEIDLSYYIAMQPFGVVYPDPVPISFPNIEGLPPESLLDIFALNHDTGEFEKIGEGLVSLDGKTVDSIGGVVQSNSWHGIVPQAPVSIPTKPDELGQLSPEDDCSTVACRINLESGNLGEDHTLPAYYSLGAARTVHLSYNSLSANPKPILNVESTFGNRAPPPDSMSIRLEVGGIDQGFEFFAETNIERSNIRTQFEPARPSVQFDAAPFTTGIYDYDLTVNCHFPISRRSETINGSTVVQNDINSPFGSGWTLVGLQRIHISENDQALLTEGNGQAIIFNPINGTDFESPPSDFSVLTRNPDNTFVRRMKDGTVYNFDSDGRQTTMVDRNANITTYIFNAQDQLIRITDPVGEEFSLTYFAGRITSISDPLNRTTQFEHDSEGNLIKIIEPNGDERDFEYKTGTSLMIAHIDQRDNRKEYTYDFAGRIQEALLPDGSTPLISPSSVDGVIDPVSSAGTGKDNLAPKPTLSKDIENVFTDQNGNVSKTQTDDNSAPVMKLDAVGRVTLNERDGDSLPTQTTRPNQSEINRLFDNLGNPTFVREEFNGAEYDYVYDPFSLVTSYTNPNNHTTTINRDPANGNALSIINHLDHTTTMEYDSRGLVTRMVSPNNLETVFTYNIQGLPETKTETPPAGSPGNIRVTSYSYDAAGQLIQTITPDGVILTMAYDDKGRPISITDNLNQTITYTYDPFNNLIKTDTSNADTSLTLQVEQAFDNRNRLVEIRMPHNGTEDSITQRILDNNSNLTGLVDPNGNPSSNQFDGEDRLIENTHRLNGITTYEYDTNDRITKVIAPNGVTTEYTYDVLGRRLTETSPDRGVLTYDYDLANNVINITEGRGIVATMTYDELERVSTKTYPNTIVGKNENVTYTYDACLFGLGYLCVRTDESGSTAYDYDAYGNMTSMDFTEIAGVTYSMSYVYDDGDNIIQSTYPSGRTVDYTRDGIRRISAIDTTLNGNAQNIINSIQYRADNQVTQCTLGNGLIDERNYDLQGRLTDQLLRTASNTMVDQRIYSYDKNSNILGIDTNVEDNAYTYDALDRLFSDTIDTNIPFDFTYDLNDNRLSKTKADLSFNEVLDYVANSNQVQQLKTLQLGTNLAALPNRQLVFNDASRLFQLIEDGALKAEYIYNDAGQRTRKTNYQADGITVDSITIYHYDHMGYLITETTETGDLIKDYIWQEGMMPVAQISAVIPAQAGIQEEIAYLYTDHLMTNRLATDETQAVVWRWEGEAFGNTAAQELSGVSVNLRFPGQYFDAETNLHYNWNRYYDPQLGRYITSDPIGLQGGLNSYSYVNANSLMNIDPFGLAQVCGRALEGFGGFKLGPLHHSQILYNDGTDSGFFDSDSIGADKGHDRSEYSCDATNYEDDKFKQAEKDVQKNWDMDWRMPMTSGWNNCQDYTDAVIDKYNENRVRDITAPIGKVNVSP